MLPRGANEKIYRLSLITQAGSPHVDRRIAGEPSDGVFVIYNADGYAMTSETTHDAKAVKITSDDHRTYATFVSYISLN